MYAPIRNFACIVAGVVATGYAASGAAADAVIGSVLALRGVVHAERAGGTQPLIVNARLLAADIVVSANGKAKLAMNDGSVVSVGEHSRVRLADHASAAGGANVRLQLISGVTRITAKIAPTGSFEVETETAIAAVRGTDWLMEATPAQTSVAVVEGVVAVTSRTADARATVVLEGERQGTDVRRGAPPTPPRPWGAQRFTDTLARASFD